MSRVISRKSRRKAKAKANPPPSLLAGDEGLPKYETLSDLPLDVLFEVFAYLDPVDLLTLAQTVKLFRRFLMNRASRAVWTRAIAVVGLPPCPPDLTEPQYVNLMFSDHCHGCKQENDNEDDDEPTVTLLMYMESRILLCKRCSLKRFKRWTQMPEKIDLALSDLTPSTTNRLTETDPAGPERFDSEVAMRLHLEYKAFGKRLTARQAWFDEKKALWEALQEHAEACETFFEVQLDNARKEEVQARLRRVGQIKQKLIELGWGPELDYPRRHPRPAQHKLVDQPYDLDDEDWEEIKPSMVAEMGNRRKRRLAEEGKRVIVTRIRAWVKPAFTDLLFSQSPNALLPSLFEVCMIPEIRSVLCTTPLELENTLTAEMFKEALLRIPAFVEDWRRCRDEEVLELVRQSATYEGQDVPENVLFLATTIFRCHHCDEAVTYPSILVHSCNFRPLTDSYRLDVIERGMTPPPPPLPAEKEEREENQNSWGKMPQQGAPRQGIRIYQEIEKHVVSAFEKCTNRWNGLGGVSFDDGCYTHMCLLLDELEWSRETTISEMEEKDPYVECFCQCYRKRGKQYRRAMRWIKAMKDCGEHKKKESCPKYYAKLEGKDLELTEFLEKVQAPTRHRDRDASCPICKSSSDCGLEWHLKNTHLVVNPDDPIHGVRTFSDARRLYVGPHLDTEHVVRLDFDTPERLASMVRNRRNAWRTHYDRLDNAWRL